MKVGVGYFICITFYIYIFFYIIIYPGYIRLEKKRRILCSEFAWRSLNLSCSYSLGGDGYVGVARDRGEGLIHRVGWTKLHTVYCTVRTTFLCFVWSSNMVVVGVILILRGFWGGVASHAYIYMNKLRKKERDWFFLKRVKCRGFETNHDYAHFRLRWLFFFKNVFFLKKKIFQTRCCWWCR